MAILGTGCSSLAWHFVFIESECFVLPTITLRFGSSLCSVHVLVLWTSAMCSQDGISHFIWEANHYPVKKSLENYWPLGFEGCRERSGYLLSCFCTWPGKTCALGKEHWAESPKVSAPGLALPLWRPLPFPHDEALWQPLYSYVT